MSPEDLCSSRFDDVPKVELEERPKSEWSSIPDAGCRTIDGKMVGEVLGDADGETEADEEADEEREEKGREGMMEICCCLAEVDDGSSVWSRVQGCLEDADSVC